MKNYKRGAYKMNFYIINQYYYPFHAATGQLLQELAEYLAEKGISVTVITGKNGKKDLKFHEKINNVEIYRVNNTKDGINFKTKFFSYLTFYFKLFFEFRNIKNGSIVMFLSTPPLIGIIPVALKKIKNLKLIYNIQDLYPDILNALGKLSERNIIYIMLKKLSKKIMKSSDIIITIGERMKELLEDRYSIPTNKIKVIQNWGLKTIKLDDKKKDNDTFKVLYSGNLGRSHEYKTLLTTILDLKENHKIEFVISGGGYNYQVMYNEAKKLKLENVRFQSFVPKEELSNLISTADVCVVIGNEKLNGIIIPSKFYGYLSAGKPVIYINNGEDDLTNHIQKGNFGYIIKNGDSESLTNILKKLSINSSKIELLSKNAKRYHSEYLIRDIPLSRYFEIIKEMEACHEKT
jgi:colanic acid biosynthesis glycosyl transferase WcaI